MAIGAMATTDTAITTVATGAKEILMRTSLKLAAIGALAGLGLAGCVAYPADGPGPYGYAQAPAPYYAPYYSGSFIYYDGPRYYGPRRYYGRPGYYRGPYARPHGGPHNFGGGPRHYGGGSHYHGGPAYNHGRH
jgi:hypothetical protein